MYIVNNEQMKAIEQRAIGGGVPSLLLMENAALSMTEEIIKDGFKRVLLFCGKGNNGGDGLACARQLYARGAEVKIIFVGNPARATEDCGTNLKAAEALNIPIIYFDRDIEEIAELKNPVEDCDLIVDALVGTGLSSGLKEPIATLVNIINGCGKPVYSCDCPSGVSTNTGEDFGTAVWADKTVTFHLPKIGLMLYPACEHVGKLAVGNISLPQNSRTPMRVLDHKEALELMPKRPKRSNKGTYGRAFAFVGCDYMTGAGLLALSAAYKIGTGLVYGFTTPECARVIRNNLPEAVVRAVATKDGCIENTENIDFSNANAVLIGCGIGCNIVTERLMADLLNKVNKNLVIDADGLNILAGNKDLLKALPKNTVLTPHLGEMARLCGKEISEIKESLLETATEFAKKYNAVVVLKDARSVIASPDGRVTINITGSPAMSKGGSGDLLAGSILGLMSQGLDSYDAACLGCYINGKAGEMAEKKLSSYGVTARDIADNIPLVFNRLKKSPTS